jgi:hypothetical protein
VKEGWDLAKEVASLNNCCQLAFVSGLEQVVRERRNSAKHICSSIIRRIMKDT